MPDEPSVKPYSPVKLPSIASGAVCATVGSMRSTTVAAFVSDDAAGFGYAIAIDAAFHTSGSPCVALVSTCATFIVGTPFVAGQTETQFHGVAVVTSLRFSFEGFGMLTQFIQPTRSPAASWSSPRDGQ